jgi:hypothetical protein
VRRLFFFKRFSRSFLEYASIYTDHFMTTEQHNLYLPYIIRLQIPVCVIVLCEDLLHCALLYHTDSGGTSIIERWPDLR